MLKKRNIAIMTAAAAVATSVVPAFAAVQEQYLNEAELIAEVERLFDVTYSNELVTGESKGTNSVYKVMASLNGGSAVEVTTISQLKGLIEQGKVKGNTLKLEVFDKGHRTDNSGKIIATESNQYVKNTTSSLADAADMEIENVIANVTTESVVLYEGADATTQVTIELTNPDAEKIVLNEDNYKLDFTKPIDANGNVIETTGISAELGRKVVGFKTFEDGIVKTNDIPTKLVNVIDFRENGVTLIEKNITDYINEEGYTEEGAALVNMLAACTSNGTAGSSISTIVSNGKTYEIDYDYTKDLTNIEAKKDGGYKLSVQFKAVTTNGTARALTLDPKNNVQITINSDSQKSLEFLRTALSTSSAVTVGGQGEYTTLAGDDRFETAIAISQETYTDKDDTTPASAVVLVGEDAIVDGLAAAPLAKQKNAPILLTKKDAVGSETLTEIKRLLEKGSTIYLVGGESVISKDVEAQLIKEMNAKIVRLAGEDRCETSIEVAKAMVDSSTSIDTTFVVGADGEADAMSIAAYASQLTTGTTVAPIIVTPAKGLTLDAKYFMDVNDVTTAAVVGGEAKVSTQVLKDLKALTNNTVERIAGDTRHDTNAMVINEFYGNGNDVETVIVAKDGYVGGNGKLIDALAVAPLAGKLEAPIVLATDDLTTSQAKEVSEAVANTTTKLYKAGNGISSTVMNKIAKMMGLNK